jgi:hypothetical protein
MSIVLHIYAVGRSWLGTGGGREGHPLELGIEEHNCVPRWCDEEYRKKVVKTGKEVSKMGKEVARLGAVMHLWKSFSADSGRRSVA